MDIFYDYYICKHCLLQDNAVSDSNCLGGGQYCHQGYVDQDSHVEIQGREFIVEIVRQLCIYSLRRDLWWDYLSMFQSKCFLQNDLAHCSRRIQSHFRIDDIDHCVQESFQLAEPFDFANEAHLSTHPLPIMPRVHLRPA